MGRFAQRYSDAQKQAIVEAVLDQGLTAPQACAQAKAGKLPNIEPFDMPAGSLYTYIKQEKKRRAGIAARTHPQTPLERLDTFTNRTLNILDHELTRLEKKAGPGKELTKEDADQMKRLAQVAREVKALGLNVQPVHGGQVRTERQRDAKAKEDAARKQAEAAPSLAEKMQRDIDREAAPTDPPTTGRAEEGGYVGAHAGRTYSNDGGEEGQDASGVLTSDAPTEAVPELVPA